MIGDSDFASNSVLGIQGNRDLFMNTIGWLSQQENLISIRPKEADDRRVTMTATQQSNMMWLSLLIIPGLHLRLGRLHAGGGAREARMRGLRSTIALLVVLAGLGAYIYFVTWKKPDTDSTGAKAGEGLRRRSRPTRSTS